MEFPKLNVGLPWITHDYSHLLGRHFGACIHDLYMPPPIDSGLGTALPKAGVQTWVALSVRLPLNLIFPLRSTQRIVVLDFGNLVRSNFLPQHPCTRLCKFPKNRLGSVVRMVLNHPKSKTDVGFLAKHNIFFVGFTRKFGVQKRGRFRTKKGFNS